MGMDKQTLAATRVHRGLLLTLVIPTRNEAGNVSRLVGELEVSLQGLSKKTFTGSPPTSVSPVPSSPRRRLENRHTGKTGREDE
jgi:hypothetical protein